MKTLEISKKEKKLEIEKKLWDDELKIMKRLQHPNIIWLHEVINDPLKDKMYLVTEWQK